MISLSTNHLLFPIKQLFNFGQESSFELLLHVHLVFSLPSLVVSSDVVE